MHTGFLDMVELLERVPSRPRDKEIRLLESFSVYLSELTVTTSGTALRGHFEKVVSVFSVWVHTFPYIFFTFYSHPQS